jgi:glucokinase
MLIAGDIGGTKTDFTIYSRESGPHTPLAQTEVHSADYPQLAGVYLAGGIALHLVDLLQKPQFVQTFTRKGRFKELM